MRFEEFRNPALDTTIDNPGDAGHGKTLGRQIPSLGQMRMWGARVGGYGWIIAFDPNHNGPAYSATYRLLDATTSADTIKVDGGPWDTLAKAEDACKRVWKQIRNPQ